MNFLGLTIIQEAVKGERKCDTGKKERSYRGFEREEGGSNVRKTDREYRSIKKKLPRL